MPKPTQIVVYVIQNSTEEKGWGRGKCEVLHFDGIQWLARRAVIIIGLPNKFVVGLYVLNKLHFVLIHAQTT